MAKESPQPLNPRGGTVLCHVRLPSLDAEKGSRTSASDVLTRSRLAIACGSGWSMLVAKKGRGVQQQPIVPVVFARDVGDNHTEGALPCAELPPFGVGHGRSAPSSSAREHSSQRERHETGSSMLPRGGLGASLPDHSAFRKLPMQRHSKHYISPLTPGVV